MKREHIRVLNGPLQGRVYDIVGSLTIGRSPENGLQLNDLQISRKHAVIQRTQSGTMIRDLGSGNGTFIGTRRILEYRLSGGDIIRIGPMDLQFEMEDQAPSATTPRPIQTVGNQTIAMSKPVQFENDDSSLVEAKSAENIYRTFIEAPSQAVTSDDLRDAQRRLAAVYEANQIISSERDISKLFARVMEQIFPLVKAHNGAILLKDDHSNELVTEFVKSGKGDSTFVISSTIVRRAYEGGEGVITFNAAGDDRFEAGMSIIAQNITSAMCTPLQHQNETLGVIYVDTRGTAHAFSQKDLELLVAISQGAATAIRNAQYLAKLEKAYQDTLVALANAVELRDHYTVGHTWRVTNFGLEIARSLGWSDEKMKECEMGGVLHDVGKISIDDAILRKAGKLTDEEYQKMQVHPERGARLMQDIDFLIPLIPYALYHHERFDGKGYPYGLSGEDIPLEGRLLAVADTLDAMTSNRPYRKGLPLEVAREEIIKGKGTQFDPLIVDAFVKACDEGRIDRILQNYHEKDAKSVACPFCSTYIRLPENVEPGYEFQCNVCHRHLLLRFSNEAYFGELLAQTEVGMGPSGPASEPSEGTHRPSVVSLNPKS
ncbi:MAG: hypothetical protein AMXMBFR84_04400 [Candidatus Hydrogenedentota bacterium]